MIYWIIYDITKNETRSKIYSKCKNYGLKHVQKSAFFGEVTKNCVEMLSGEIREILNDKTDCVFVIPSCKDCFKEKIINGKFDESKLTHKKFTIFGSDDFVGDSQ